MRGLFAVVIQVARREAWLNIRDEAEQRRGPLNVTGDAVPPDHPPLVWVRLWDAGYANIHGEYIGDKLKECGHVMWDSHRWGESGT